MPYLPVLRNNSVEEMHALYVIQLQSDLSKSTSPGTWKLAA